MQFLRDGAIKLEHIRLAFEPFGIDFRAASQNQIYSRWSKLIAESPIYY